MNHSLAVVVVHWNGAEPLRELMRSLHAQTTQDWFLVVVDNASHPLQRAQLRALVPESERSEILWNEKNVGFAGGANVGVGRALARGARWVLLTTQDTVLEPATLAAFQQVAPQLGEAVLAGPVVYDRDSGSLLSAGERASLWYLAWPRRWAFAQVPDTAVPYYAVSGLLGCTLFFSAAAWQRLGGFWEDLFAYYEEVDLAMRARRHGIRTVVVPAARVYHGGWRGFRRGLTAVSAELKARNVHLLFRRHARWYHYLLLGPLVEGLIVMSVLFAAVRLDWPVVRALLRGAWTGLRGRGGALSGLPVVQPCVPGSG